MNTYHLSQTFSFEGHEVRYDVFGSGSPVILVHGTPWSSYNLRHLTKGLSQHYQVYTFDLLGYGQSEKSDTDVSLGIQNRILDSLIDHWQVEFPSIIGHDFGGTTVLRNHILNQRDFDKIVIIDPVALSPWGSPFFQHIRSYETAFSTVPDFIHRAIVEAYIQTAAHQPLLSETLEQTLLPWIGKYGQPAFYRQISQADARFTDEFQDRFDEIRAKVLIIWGEEDRWIPCRQAYELQRRIKGSELVTIPDTGHLVIEEKPEIVIEKISSFFRT